jgi:hypothetical protein
MQPVVAETAKRLRQAIKDGESFLWVTGAKSPTGAVLKAAEKDKAEEEPGEFGADDGPPRRLKIV